MAAVNMDYFNFSQTVHQVVTAEQTAALPVGSIVLAVPTPDDRRPAHLPWTRVNNIDTGQSWTNGSKTSSGLDPLTNYRVLHIPLLKLPEVGSKLERAHLDYCAPRTVVRSGLGISAQLQDACGPSFWWGMVNLAAEGMTSDELWERYLGDVWLLWDPTKY